MPREPAQLDLPDGWTCSIELRNCVDGGCAGTAELRQGREVRCLLVVALLPSREAVLERIRFRVDHFIQDWNKRLEDSGRTETAGGERFELV